uniref:Zinc finger protein n=1 Tax=Ciona intestinalis TaxID=7719 RepID=Q1RLH4_CIOIN|nr:zinc finger protein ArfGAP-2 [Ciona intestinalis]FAA00091.1 TPA: zinc finger protein [Ciona intestinalis]|eukprot:NP_001121584.1 zinc finger protein ArfGAP-2 [Ciona intestinalis]
MSTRAEREKQTNQNERHKNILAKFLAKEENKFCADCLAKGPRWVSWNLGVLLCIRCSGIHRSLGVHISKVKSVNLDTWTNEQMIKVCSRGNGWGRDYYEANLPTGHKRPNTDSSLEYFIRDKYERKKYLSSSDIPLRSIEEYGITGESREVPKKKKEVGKISAPISNWKTSPTPRPHKPTNMSQDQQPQMGIPQQPMGYHGYQQQATMPTYQQNYQQQHWQQQQQQQLQHQMHTLNIGNTGMRSHSSMPQMHGAGGFTQYPPNPLTSSQPSLMGLDPTMGSWGNGGIPMGQTLSNQLWK